MKSVGHLFVFAATVSAFPEYIAPDATDSRSPCPALNIMANHGYLNRNGRGLTGQNFMDACFECFSVSNDLIKVAIGAAVDTGMFVNGTLDLADLARHPEPGSVPAILMEHDMSLTRMDAFLGENVKPSSSLIDLFLNRGATDVLTTDDVVAQYFYQYNHSLAFNEDFVFGEVADILAAEASLLLSIEGDSITSVSKDFFEAFFREERLMDGWENRVARNLPQVDSSLIEAQLAAFADRINAFAAAPAESSTAESSTDVDESAAVKSFASGILGATVLALCALLA